MRWEDPDAQRAGRGRAAGLGIVLAVGVPVPAPGADGSDLGVLTGLSSEQFGSLVRRIPDVDEDGREDNAISATRADLSQGRVYLYSSRNGKRIGRLGGTDGYRDFGSVIEVMGDLTGDGKPGLVVSSVRQGRVLQMFDSASREPICTLSRSSVMPEDD